MSDQNESKPAPTLGPDIMAAVGRQLRVIYADVVAEGVPEHFVELSRRLDEPNNEGSKKNPRHHQRSDMGERKANDDGAN